MSYRVPVRIGDTTLPMVRLMLRASGLPRSAWASLLADKAHGPAVDFDSPDARFDLTDLMRVGEALTRASPAGEELGLAMGRISQDTDLGLPAQIARTAPNLRQALAGLMRYNTLMTRCYRGAPSLHLGTAPALRLYSIAPYNRYNRFVVDSALAIWKRLIEQLTGRADALLAVDLEYEQCDYLEAHTRHFGVPVHTGQLYNQLLLNPAALDWPVTTYEPQLHAQLCRLGDQLLKAQAVGETLTGRLQQWLGPRLQGQTPTLDDAAAAMGMAAWTLRRRLILENSSYQTLLDDLRRDLATGHIRETTLSFGEVAFMLGFSSPGAFQRAFKRWTGETPGEYRRRAQEQRRRQGGAPGAHQGVNQSSVASAQRSSHQASGASISM